MIDALESGINDSMNQPACSDEETRTRDGGVAELQEVKQVWRMLSMVIESIGTYHDSYN